MAGKQGHNASAHGFQPISAPVNPLTPESLKLTSAGISEPPPEAADPLGEWWKGYESQWKAYQSSQEAVPESVTANHETARPSAPTRPLPTRPLPSAPEPKKISLRAGAHLRSDAPQHIAQVDDTGAIQNRCSRCGQFIDGSHECHKMATKTKVIYATSLAITGGMAAGAIALGPIALGAVVGLALIGILVRRQRIKKVKVSPKEQDAINFYHDHVSEFAYAEDTVAELKESMGVKGDITLLPTKDAGTSVAMAARVSKDRSFMFVSDKVLALPEPQLRGVLAHEMAHLQKSPLATGWYNKLQKVAFPAAVVGVAATGLAALPAGAVAITLYFMIHMASNAASRVEETRADKEAYKVSGEDYADALDAIHQTSPEYFRRDLIWRLEDALFNHPSLPNRLKDMRS